MVMRLNVSYHSRNKIPINGMVFLFSIKTEKKVKQILSSKKVMATVSWDQKGVLSIIWVNERQ